MSHISYSIYYNLFENIKTIFNYYSIEDSINEKYIMIDFEKSSRKAIKEVFPSCHLMGCYFHYTKAVLNKARKEGLTKKNLIEDTYLLIFSFKIYQFIKEKENYLKQIKEQYKDKNQFNNFIKYFEKNLKSCNFLNFENLEQKEIDERTDNICEIFHNNLNKLVNIPHHKISFLEKLKDYIKSQFDKQLV